MRAVLAVALAGQLIAPGAFASLSGPGGDAIPLICAPSGHLSDNAEAAVRSLLGLIDQDDNAPPVLGVGHCDHCVLGGAVIAPSNVELTRPIRSFRLGDAPKPTWRTSVGATGPPLGGRAPPFFH